MKSYRFYIVDVFAEEKYAGNQLAVVLDADTLSTAEMQRIARETNFSETTFVTSAVERDGGYDVRIFTPNEELPFAGHPTLGTAFVIRREIIRSPCAGLALNLEVGQIPVTFQVTDGGEEVLWMRQQPPTFGARGIAPENIAPVLGIEVAEIDVRFPIEEVSTGLPCIIVPLKTLATVKRIRVNRDRYFELIDATVAKSVFVFCPETYHPDNQLNARLFADYYGVSEDPATGSANGGLAGYLVKHRYFSTDEIELRVEQGYEIKRPSLLRLRAARRDARIEVEIGGKVFLSVEGRLV